MGKSIALAVVLMAVAITCCNNAQAGPRGDRDVSRGGRFSFRLESNGRTMRTHNHRGRTYVEGTYGRAYQVRVYNHTGQRAEAVVTVDGRDVVSGQPGDYRSQRGYVIAPNSSVLIEGFRTSFSDVAQFRFTDTGDSYAARMGDASNVGVIGVAVFTERRYRRRPYPQDLADDRVKRPRSYGHRAGRGYGESESSGSTKNKDSSRSRSGEARRSPSAPSYDWDGYTRDERRSQGLGTQYGSQRYSPAETTRFIRRRANRPDHLLTVRYDDRQGLIDKGVIAAPRPYYRAPIEKPNPFPNSTDPRFAPPPPGYYYER